MLERVRRGLKQFQSTTYKDYETLYQELEAVQHPHTLFIACSDSRVSPEMLIDTKPGEVFTIRNIANTVPASADHTQNLTTLSAIEFAVKFLQVEEIIICGHSNCGGCAAALSNMDGMESLSFTKEYLKPLESVKKIVDNLPADEAVEPKARLMEKQNVIEQMKHLKEYDFIRERIVKGELEVEGWHYDIGTGEVIVYDEKKDCFVGQ